MNSRAATHRRFAVHGLAVELLCEVPFLDEYNVHWLWPFEADAFPDAAVCTAGSIRPYEQGEVMRHLSPSAVPVATPGQSIELYQEGDRFWTPADWAWIGGLINSLLSTLYNGQPIVAAPRERFDAEWAAALIAHAGVLCESW